MSHHTDEMEKGMSPTVEQVLEVLTHELRSPIGVAQGYLRVLLDGTAPAETDRAPLLERTKDAVSRLGDVVRQADELARRLGGIASGKPMPLSVDAVSKAIADTCVGVGIPYTDETTAHGPMRGSIRGSRTDVLAGAVGGLVAGLRRERADVEVVAAQGPARTFRLIVSSQEDRDTLEESAAPVAVPVDRGGLGVSFVGSLLILGALGAHAWTVTGLRSAAVVDFHLED
jgi:hypothetical protein